MKRIAVIIGMVVVLGTAFVVLKDQHRAEGLPQTGSVAAAPAAAGGSAPKGPQPVPITASAALARDMRQVLEVSGSLRTDDDVQIGSRLAGKVVSVTVKEGDRVTRGQVLVRLDERELRAQIARAQATLTSSRAKLSLARNQSTWKDASAQSDHERAEAGLVTAKSRLQQAETNQKIVEVDTKKKVETAQSGVRVALERLSIVKDATRKQELRQAELAVDQAMAELGQARVDMDNARQVWERRAQLFKQDAIAKEEVDEADRGHKSAQARVKVAESVVAASREKVELAKEGSRAEEIRIALGQLSAAERALETALSEERRRDVAADEVAQAKSAVLQAQAVVSSSKAGLVQTAMSRDEVDAARAAIQQAQADIAFYGAQLSDLTIRAPVSGVVSTRSVNEGEMVTTSSALMTLVALDTVYFEALVPELEVGLLKPGAAATVTVDALPGQKFNGAVREVIPVADRTSRAFRVRMAVLRSANKLPANSFARATVFVGTRQGAVAVAKEAVLSEAGDKYVWLVADGEQGTVAKRQTVAVGLVDDRYAEITGGLQAGQRVIVAGSPAIIEGTPIEVSTK
ncbi:MAG: family efflux transporter, subunit [Armatimonadetes bacterium]|jgi:RND family efflux transporter MFP subunit|nr:family efflux transporter, subunit [Armatimonadota bacterium]